MRISIERDMLLKSLGHIQSVVERRNTIPILSNVKIIAAISWDLFMHQSNKYRQKIISDNEWMDSMIITNGARTLMKNWISNKIVEEYSLSPDYDNRWRTGGSVDEIVTESKLDSKSIWEGINRFAVDRKSRLDRIRQSIPL